MALNVFTFTARIGKDCETRYTNSGDAIVNFTAAVSSGYGDKEVTTWVNCSMFGKRGEAVSLYLLKGTQIAVSGELTNRKYTDKSGNEKYSLDVRVNDVTLLGGKQESQQSAQPAPERQAQSVEDMDDMIPF
jgi:single-strand DNA-binding protein